MISTEKNAILFMPAPFTCRTLKSLGFFVKHLDWCPTVVYIYPRHSQLLPLKWDKVAERKVSRASLCPLCPATGVSAVSCSLELCMVPHRACREMQEGQAAAEAGVPSPAPAPSSAPAFLYCLCQVTSPPHSSSSEKDNIASFSSSCGFFSSLALCL